jgi:hypothetical protein
VLFFTFTTLPRLTRASISFQLSSRVGNGRSRGNSSAKRFCRPAFRNDNTSSRRKHSYDTRSAKSRLPRNNNAWSTASLT